ncbi:MAG: hypothetical protein ACK6DM_02555 [Alphaproteobacteria bacterium]
MSFSAEQVRLGLLAVIAALLLALNVQVYVTFGQGRAIEVYDTSEALASGDIKSAIKAALSDCTVGSYTSKSTQMPDIPDYKFGSIPGGTFTTRTHSSAPISQESSLSFSCDTN